MSGEGRAGAERDGLRPDLVVAGAGGGLAGALRAAELGLRVLVVEASQHYAHGNNTSMSTAMVPGAGSRWQKEAGIDDSPEIFLADVMAKTKGNADPAVSRALTGVGARLVAWLADYVGLPMELATDIPYPGHTNFRCHTVPGRSGTKMLAGLIAKAEADPKIDILAPARLVDARPSREGLAALIEFPDGAQEAIECGSLLLATNGFGANRELVERYIPEIAEATYHGSAESRGDGLRIGLGLGADADCLDAYQGHAALAVPYATLLGWATMMHGGILVNSEARRFGNESRGYSEYAAEVLAQPGGTAIAIIDEYVFEKCQPFDDFRATVEAGALRWANNVEELAELFGLDGARLSATLAEARACSENGTEDGFGRSWWPHTLNGRLGGVRVTGALFHTQGGLRVDEHAAVLREDGTRVEHLYASGGAAVGMSGHGASGYLAGNGLLPALGLAFLAAEEVARLAGRVS